MQLGVRPLPVGGRNSLTSEFRSLHLLQGLGAVADARGDAPGSAAKPVLLGGQAAPSGTRGMGDPAAVKRFRRVPVGGLATGRCGGHAEAGRQAKHCAHRGILMLMSCDKAFQDPCTSETREPKYVQQHIRICTHGVKTGLG